MLYTSFVQSRFVVEEGAGRCTGCLLESSVSRFTTRKRAMIFDCDTPWRRFHCFLSRSLISDQPSKVKITNDVLLPQACLVIHVSLAVLAVFLSTQAVWKLFSFFA